MRNYIVMEIGYEYNDNYYERHENNDGLPINVFTSMEKALERKKELELETWYDCKLANYLYFDELTNSIDYDKLMPLLVGEYQKGDVPYISFSRDIYDKETMEKIMSCFDTEFYSVYEVVQNEA